MLLNSRTLKIAFTYKVLESPATQNYAKSLIEFFELKSGEIYTSKLKGKSIELAKTITFSKAFLQTGDL